ncbi:MarR family winged helix-turn-helix transcriptional regulator [Enterococcus alcedinis]|uniref:HTH marR-type domain-containing protein n=1 Tax=Enterococcus alcedinis TaxID=1274384 RepID=A0A917JFS3_9ENTE|nr:MarR family transcriptional regulator [Enterococcus alcedinis]MBP2100831.1 DNA-binding MarR family transcriptional regulator [Enterococcus alcedinis]GGI64871.1 hypothetical protein GCM10011482_05250 [Enterococcus alcedinis]
MDLKKISRLLYQLKLANQEMTSIFEKETGISLTRYELMLFLKDHGPCCQIDLQNALSIDSAAVTRHLKVLEDQGYVTRERNQDNKREVFVQITERAQQAMGDCQTKVESLNPSFNIPLDEIEEEQLFFLLTKLIK